MSRANRIYHYFVEGECEAKLIKELKDPSIQLFISGKIDVFNVVNQKLTINRLLSLNKDTVIILIYDIDVPKTEILEYNVNLLKKYQYKNVYHIQSINNFEDEILYSTNLKNICEMFNTEKRQEFKSRFISHRDLFNKLKDLNFDHTKIWSRTNNNPPFNKFSFKEHLSIIKTTKK